MDAEELRMMKNAEDIIQRQRTKILGLELALEQSSNENKALWLMVSILTLLILGYGLFRWFM